MYIRIFCKSSTTETSSKGQRKSVANRISLNLLDSLDMSLIHALISQYFEMISTDV